ncbi:transcriptional regulator [Exophiala xenobiotica]|uniref:Transcriptional regulator n=1 Tax=Vermiconidia calcicola TaxID=1690605 RepID=A0AAV9QM46_9PEZI|nr:ATP-dependent DNA helicase Snf21 [Exophiala xenobiotica]KAK5534848.1 transcriptional regulator [Chaetothyriales sp. CCFEE 6169]KAK5545582.1 transcriptional regulator [Vermiconidia calcicola]KAK5208499.1 transcriptional regulator [Exophiala xenobiotica]KAK5230036.1 transcriptional regulator [Exophiala xenobiotica]
MASVQSAPTMQAHNTALPPNLSQAQVQEVYQKFQRMKAQNVPETDPEYLKAHRFLAAVQQQQNYRKMAALQAQKQQLQAQQQQPAAAAAQQQQMPQQPQPNGQQANGDASQPSTNGATISQLDGTGAAVNGTSLGPNQPATASNNAQTAGTVAQRAVTQANGSFSPEQLNLLRTQIYAFKMLSKNLPLPAKLQQQLFPSLKQQAATTTDRPSTSEKVADAAADKKDAVSKELAQAKAHFDSYQSPYSLLAKMISFSDHAQRAKRQKIPSIMPIGIDIEQVRAEQERLLFNRIQARKAELASQSANVASWDASKFSEPQADDSLKIKALIEFKKLSLAQKQRDLRRELQQDLYYYDNLAMTANRSMHRRMKKQSLREARITEKLEKQQRDARENKEKTRQSNHLQSIIAHGQDLRNNGISQRGRIQKLGRMMVTHHQHMEREEQKRIERTAKQRLQALRANDEETYLKLLGQAKDSRITHLLKQTDGFLKQLAASVREQQRSAAERYGNMEEEEEGPGDSEDEEGGGKVDYYAVAHRIKEEVNIQPSILVGGTLKEYQLKGLQWMISLFNNNLNGILADEMGLGKTIQTISLITYLIEKKRQYGPFLIVVPLSTLTNWTLEFDKWAPSVKRIVYKGPPATRKTQQQSIRQGNFQVLLTTYEYIIKDRPILSKIKWVHMIVDEGHRMKNAQSKLSSTITQYYTTRYRLILTGTPLQNNLPELWALLNFVLPTIFKSVKSFDEWFNTPFANTGGQDKMELSEEESLLIIRRLHKVLRPFLLRRLKKDVEKDLPDKQERVVKCRFSALQNRLNIQLMTHNRLVIADGKGGKTSMRGLSNMLMQLRKLCNHPYVFEPVEDQMNPGRGTNDSIWRTSGKFELLDRILPKFRATNHRVLMFFQMTQIMNIMEDFMRLRGIPYLRLDGATKAEDRSELLRLFNEPNSPYFCFLLSTRAGGLGLNLQTADTVIIYDSDWNPHQDLQAQDRAHRIGQKNEVRILRLITSNSVEEKILERAQFKLDMDGKVIQAGKFDNKSTAEERDAFLKTLLESAEAAEVAAETEEMDDDDLNEIMARTEDELVLFKQMDKDRDANEPYGPGKPLPRLMGEDELPEIYLSEENPVQEEVEEYTGRGARVKTQVKYDDGLTEEQWLAAVDDSDDSIGEAAARKAARIEKRRTNKAKRERAATGVGSSPEPDPETSEEEEEPQPKKKGPRKSAGQKRKGDDIEEETPATKRKRGRQPKTTDTLTPSDRSALQKALKRVFESLKTLEVPDSDPEDQSEDESDDEPPTRLIIGPFLELPPKKLYPDYYNFIQDPIAMDMIEKRINNHQYTTLKDFSKDVGLLAKNAKTYNEDGSMLYNDAIAIENHCNEEIAKQIMHNPHLASIGDGGSTAAGSSAGTPRGSVAPVGGTKLRLTLGGGSNGFATNGTTSGAASGTE